MRPGQTDRAREKRAQPRAPAHSARPGRSQPSPRGNLAHLGDDRLGCGYHSPKPSRIGGPELPRMQSRLRSPISASRALNAPLAASTQTTGARRRTGDCESGGRDGERGAAGQSAHAVPIRRGRRRMTGRASLTWAAASEVGVRALPRADDPGRRARRPHAAPRGRPTVVLEGAASVAVLRSAFSSDVGEGGCPNA